MTDTRFETAKKIDAHQLVWQDARAALLAIGFLPLVGLGQAEHWVRDDRRVILYVDAPDANDAVCSETMLARAAFVRFAIIGDVLVAVV